MSPVCVKLSELRPLHINIVSAGKELELFKSMIDQHHYLKYSRSIGENMKYMIYGCDGRPLSCLCLVPLHGRVKETNSSDGINLRGHVGSA